MQGDEMNRLLRRTMRRTDIFRAVALGVALAACILVSAYVNLSAGLMLGIGAFLLLGALWSYTHKRRQQPIAERVTTPALREAFEQPAYSLPAALPENEIAKLFPDARRIRSRDQVCAAWHGMPFTFANLVVRGRKRREQTTFHGQWLAVRTDWQLPGRVLIRPHTAEDEVAPDSQSALPAVDSALLRMYRVETDNREKAACLLACPLLAALLSANPGTHLLAEDASVYLAIPSEEAFFELSGLEESIAQVNDANARQIAALQAWLDGLLAVEMPEGGIPA